MNNKSKSLMLILTILFPGLGNLYIGDKNRGITLLVVSIVTMVLSSWIEFLSIFFIVIYIHAITSCFSTYNKVDQIIEKGTQNE